MASNPEPTLVMREDLPDDLQAAVRRIRDNFLIALIKRAGGSIEMPVREVDAADGLLTFEVDQQRRVFILHVHRRQ